MVYFILLLLIISLSSLIVNYIYNNKSITDNNSAFNIISNEKLYINDIQDILTNYDLHYIDFIIDYENNIAYRINYEKKIKTFSNYNEIILNENYNKSYNLNDYISLDNKEYKIISFTKSDYNYIDIIDNSEVQCNSFYVCLLDNSNSSYLNLINDFSNCEITLPERSNDVEDIAFKNMNSMMILICFFLTIIIVIYTSIFKQILCIIKTINYLGFRKKYILLVLVIKDIIFLLLVNFIILIIQINIFKNILISKIFYYNTIIIFLILIIVSIENLYLFFINRRNIYEI